MVCLLDYERSLRYKKAILLPEISRICSVEASTILTNIDITDIES